MKAAAFALVLAAVMIGYTGGGLVGTAQSLQEQPPAAAAPVAGQPTVWYFYLVRWGFQDEFVNLYKKNHYPILKEWIKTGRLAGMRAYAPTYHGDGRADWTFAVALTYRDADALTGPSGEADIARRLFPDQATFKKEEQRRFELLDAHWDVPLTEVDLEKR